jgi:putative hydrolase of the HAD superfamily
MPEYPFKVILFDLGGVHFDIDYQLAQDAFRKLGWTEVEDAYEQNRQTALFDQYECGKISTADLCNEIREILQDPELSNEQIAAAWNAMLLGLPKGAAQWLKELKKDFRLGLLSNTNDLHIAEVRCSNPHFAEFEAQFDHVFYSHELGLRKPHPEVFLEVCRQMGAKPEEVIFIDDTLQHVNGAREAGLQAFYYSKKHSLTASGTTPQEFLRLISGG